MLDSLKLYESELRELLPEGEKPLVAVPCSVAFGADRLERSPQEIERLFRFLPGAVRGRAVELLEGAPAQRDGKAWDTLLDKVIDTISGDLVKGDPDEWLGGVAAAGHVGSIAHRLANALSSQNPECVVTDRRVVFAVHKRGSSAFEELVSVPRQAVITARRSGRFLQRGRVVVDFVDLSQLALSTGAVFAGQARRLVAGLTGGMEREGD